MAIYSMHVSNVSRAAGSSSVASLSYITAERMKDELYGKTYNGFGRRERVIETGTMLPEGAPGEYADPARLFNAIELHEKAVNARTAKKIMVAFPRELTAGQRREALRAFIGEQITGRGYACAYAVHDDGHDGNPHAHILIANRQIDPRTGAWSAKRRMEYVLDDEGRRVPQIDPRTGEQKTDKRGRRQWKRVSRVQNPLDQRETLQSMREGWASACNGLLPEGVTIDHRSNEARGIEDIPTKHEGYAARRMESEGIPTEVGDWNREVGRANRLLHELARQLDTVRQLIQQVAAAIRRRVSQPTPDPWADEKPGIPTIPVGKPRVQATPDPQEIDPWADEPEPPTRPASPQELAELWRSRAYEAAQTTLDQLRERAARRVDEATARLDAERLRAEGRGDAARLIAACDGYDEITTRMDEAGPLKRITIRRELREWVANHPDVRAVADHPDVWPSAAAYRQARLPDLIAADPQVRRAERALSDASEWRSGLRWRSPDREDMLREARRIAAASREPNAEAALKLIETPPPTPHRRRVRAR